MSVRGGRRVEIKGVPQAWRAPALVHGEAVRQVEMLRLRAELRSRGLTRPEDVGVEHHDVTELCAASELSLLRPEGWERFVADAERHPEYARGEGPFRVRAVRLPGLAGTPSWPGQPGRTFADELAGRVRVIAALDQPPILLHDRAWPDYPGAAAELERLRTAAGCGGDDALVVIWGAERDTVTAAEEIRLRYADACDGVPNETRQPLDGGATAFERILPGPDRMYPDTDSPPQRVTRERVARLQAALPEPPWLREERYAAAGVRRDTIHYLIRRNGARSVDRVVAESGADLRRTCLFFGEEAKGLRRAGVAVDSIDDDRWCELFGRLAERPVLWEARRQLVERMAREPRRPLAELLSASGLDDPPAGWRGELDDLAGRSAPATDRDPATTLRHLMGLAMGRLRGRVPGHRVRAHLEACLAPRPVAEVGDRV